jgi:acetyl esterase/lipase
MKTYRRLAVSQAVLACLLLLSAFSAAQLTPAESNAATMSGKYSVKADIVYLTANNYQNRLDVFQPAGDDPHPTLIYIHGGGWVEGRKEGDVLEAMPFLEKGWAVVNVEYRLAGVSLAPAAVEDCRCALRWVIEHAKEYKFDTNRIVLMGHSAGGHLSLITGMLPLSAGLDRECAGDKELKVAAIVDWFGITDVNDLLQGPNLQDYAVTWLGSLTDRDQIAKRVSPLTYVRPGLPPTIMIHGDADDTVPYSHSVRLHQALDKAGVPNELLTIPGGKHGDFSNSQLETCYVHIWAFLSKYLPQAK